MARRLFDERSSLARKKFVSKNPHMTFGDTKNERCSWVQWPNVRPSQRECCHSSDSHSNENEFEMTSTIRQMFEITDLSVVYSVEKLSEMDTRTQPNKMIMSKYILWNQPRTDIHGTFFSFRLIFEQQASMVRWWTTLEMNVIESDDRVNVHIDVLFSVLCHGYNKNPCSWGLYVCFMHKTTTTREVRRDLWHQFSIFLMFGACFIRPKVLA